MNCELTRIEIDIKADMRKVFDVESLSREARSHLAECSACTRYFESARAAGDAIMNEQLVAMPAGLHDRLVHLEDKDRAESVAMFNWQLISYVLKIVIPVTLIWAIGRIMPPPAFILVEISLIIFAMILVFEKIGRRLVTDRV